MTVWFESKRVLVPLVRGQTARPLLSFGDALLSDQTPGDGVVLGIVENARHNHSLPTADLDRVREMLKWIAQADYDHDGKPAMSVEVRFTADAAEGIRAAVQEHGSGIVVLGYPWLTEPRQHRLRAVCEALLDPVPADMVLLRPARDAMDAPICPGSILIAVRGGPHENLIARIARAFTRNCGSRVTLLHVHRPGDHQDRRRRSEEVLQRFAERLVGAEVTIEMAENASPMAEIVRAAASHDMVIAGSHLAPQRSKVLLSPPLRYLVSRCEATVVVSHSAESGNWALP